MINMENPITDNLNKHHKTSHSIWFRSNPEAIEALTKNHINIANIANNHINDYGILGY